MLFKPVKTIDPVQAWNAGVARSAAYRRAAGGEDERFWERHADVYLRNRTSGEHYARVTQWLLRKVRDKSLIEIGPGPGVFTRFLTDHCAQVTAVEPSPANAARLRRDLGACPGFCVKQKKWEDADLRPHDLVFSAGALCMFPKIESALTKMLRCARTAVLLVTLHEEPGIREEIAAFLGLPRPAPSALGPALLQDVLRGAGFVFSHEHFTETLSYTYPNVDFLLDLWKDQMPIGRRRRPALEVFLEKRGLSGGGRTAVRIPKCVTTCMVEISS